MDTRRAFFGFAASAAATLIAKQSEAQQTKTTRQLVRAAQKDSLQNRGAPIGRIGAATRGTLDHGDVTIDLVAPLRGIALTAVDQPELFYVFSGKTAQSFRMTISTPSLARPLASFEFPSIPSSGIGVVRLRDHHVRLPANKLCVWSLTLPLDPHAPSQDLVCSALVRYQPNSPAFRNADRQAPIASRIAALAQAGYWYDAISLAWRNQNADHGAALASLFRQADLPLANIADSARR